MPLGRAIVTSMPSRAAGLARQALPFELRLLVDVAGLQRRVLVRRRMLDVAVNADRAAVHDAPHAGARRRLDELADRRGVDCAIRLVRQPGLPVDRGDVIHDVDAGHGAIERGAIAQIAGRRSRCPAASRSRRRASRSRTSART